MNGVVSLVKVHLIFSTSGILWTNITCQPAPSDFYQRTKELQQNLFRQQSIAIGHATENKDETERRNKLYASVEFIAQSVEKQLEREARAESRAVTAELEVKERESRAELRAEEAELETKQQDAKLEWELSEKREDETEL